MREKDRCVLIMNGHAGTSGEECAIVCASASMLICTLQKAVGKRAERFTCCPGHAYICIPLKGDDITRVQTVITGLRLLADAYPEYVFLSEDLPKEE